MVALAVERSFGEFSSSRAEAVHFERPLADELKCFRWAGGCNNGGRGNCLDRQDGGKALTVVERREAEGLVELAQMLPLRARRVSGSPHSDLSAS